jgi:hypothetical protein
LCTGNVSAPLSGRSVLKAEQSCQQLLVACVVQAFSSALVCNPLSAPPIFFLRVREKGEYIEGSKGDWGLPVWLAGKVYDKSAKGSD